MFGKLMFQSQSKVTTLFIKDKPFDKQTIFEDAVMMA